MDTTNSKFTFKTSYSNFTPTCCAEHNIRRKKRKHIETSGWKFQADPKIIRKRNFDPWSRSMPSTQEKQKRITEIDELLEETKKTLLENLENVKSKLERSSNLLPQECETTSKKSRETSEYRSLRKLRRKKEEPSPYMMLLNRLDEEEGVRDPSAEDKLKLAEDSLRISTAKFCKACNGLAKTGKYITPETVNQLFHPQVFESSLCPPITLSVSEVTKPSLITSIKPNTLEKDDTKQEKLKERLKQGYYLPVHAWFPSKKQTVVMSSEEIELLNSTSTKAFLKFLEKRKKKPPKVLTELLEKLKKMQEITK
ncbi:uncharacterized protein LOC118193927 isoform X1 [Stegodyphus dumicola]|uniref:uncharacterized protein LOC118193927 isoform X1 n=1 Tax=Stegodyphus dumicola TaxID=202533 RepID=UPI0015AFDAC8|nr:uncharacterized protein LOC118193927 isoform X1 [Stegodyphus dumicola]